MHFKVPPINVQIPACILKINAPLTHYLVLFSVTVGLCVCTGCVQENANSNLALPTMIGFEIIVLIRDKRSEVPI